MIISVLVLSFFTVGLPNSYSEINNQDVFLIQTIEDSPKITNHYSLKLFETVGMSSDNTETNDKSIAPILNSKKQISLHETLNVDSEKVDLEFISAFHYNSNNKAMLERITEKPKVTFSAKKLAAEKSFVSKMFDAELQLLAFDSSTFNAFNINLEEIFASEESKIQPFSLNAATDLQQEQYIVLLVTPLIFYVLLRSENYKLKNTTVKQSFAFSFGRF